MRPLPVERGDGATLEMFATAASLASSAVVTWSSVNTLRPGLGLPTVRTATGKVYILESGVYDLSQKMSCTSAAAGYMNSRLLKNGALAERGSTGRVDAGAALIHSVLARKIRLERGDYLECAIEFSFAGPVNTDGYLGLTYLGMR